MNFLKKNLFTVCGLVLLVTMGLCSEAWADGASLMTTAQTKTRNVFDNVKTITFIIGGFGLVGIAYSAIIGKVNLKWFADLTLTWIELPGFKHKTRGWIWQQQDGYFFVKCGGTTAHFIDRRFY